MEIKTSELTGPALDWAVAKCDLYLGQVKLNQHKRWNDLGRTQVRDDDWTEYSPSTDWSQGGPIMGREKINVEWWGMDWWHAWIDSKADLPPIYNKRGPTPLIAAMRCFVASKMGDSIDIPKELL